LVRLRFSLGYIGDTGAQFSNPLGWRSLSKLRISELGLKFGGLGSKFLFLLSEPLPFLCEINQAL
jgi:hypothetical protein